MVIWKHGVVRSMAVGACAFGVGCTTPGGSTGGNGNTNSGGDSLARYQLGRDTEFDALVSTITQADNRIVDCLEAPTDAEDFTDQETLDALKAGYLSFDSPEGTFDEFVGTISENEPVKADEICDTQLGQDAAFDATVGRLTDALNRLADCTGGESTDTTQALATLKRTYFRAVEASPPLADFAAALTGAAEAEAEAACNP